MQRVFAPLDLRGRRTHAKIRISGQLLTFLFGPQRLQAAVGRAHSCAHVVLLVGFDTWLASVIANERGGGVKLRDPAEVARVTTTVTSSSGVTPSGVAFRFELTTTIPDAS